MGYLSRGRERSRHTAGAFVHGLVGQAVGFLIVFAESVADGEPVELGDQFFGAAVEILECGIFYFVDAFDLADEEFGVADEFEGFGAVLDGVFEGGDEALIFGEVVGLVAEVFAEGADFVSGLVLNDYAEASGSGVAAGSAIAVGD
jgi:hypothetical protein